MEALQVIGEARKTFSHNLMQSTSMKNIFIICSVLILPSIIGCGLPENMLEIQVIDKHRKPLSGVQRYPKNKIWDMRGESDKEGRLWIYKNGVNKLYKPDYESISVHDDSRLVYSMQPATSSKEENDDEIEINWNKQ